MNWAKKFEKYEKLDEDISIVILGSEGCGKSCITLRLIGREWIDDYDPTIEDSYTTEREIDGFRYKLNIIDTAGQEEYRGLLEDLWSKGNIAEAYVLVYDVSRADTLKNLEQFDDYVSNAQENNFAPHLLPPVRMLVGNKCDINVVASRRQIAFREGAAWARRRGCEFIEASALTDVNIEQMLRILIRRVMENRILMAEAKRQIAIAKEEMRRSPRSTLTSAGSTLVDPADEWPLPLEKIDGRGMLSSPVSSHSKEKPVESSSPPSLSPPPMERVNKTGCCVIC
ncbi:P-loop containing nucleoside triphosphate hydrolase protein [Dipodascopsis uninucleata]